MVDHLPFLLLLLGGVQVVWPCPCNGVLIPGPDQVHCWEVISGGASGGWVSADVACQSMGGHLGHLNTDLTALRPYLEKIYARPILTGIVVGNADTDRYAMVCPNNVYYGLLNGTMSASLLAQNGASSSSCGFVTNADYKIHFAPCETPADALCDRPVEKVDYCSIQMNCTTTTTVTIPSTTTRPSSTVTTSIGTSTTTTDVVNTTTSSASITTPSATIPSKRSNSPDSSSPSATPPTIGMESTTTLWALLSSTKSPSPVDVQPQPTCPPAENCHWKIFGTCAPWFPWLLLALLLLALLLLICCCCHLCKEKRTEQVVVTPEEYKQQESVLPTSRPLTVPSTSAGRSVVSYSPEPTMPNPPVVVDSTPVVVVPMFPPRTEVVEKLTKEFTKEIHVLEKEKVIMKEIGVNTDPWTPTLEVMPSKQKKTSPAPIEIHDDIADDISIKIPDSPGIDADEVPDFGDDDNDNYNFVRNPKPENFGDEPLGDVPPQGDVRSPRARDPATVINLTADPRNIRSPPTKQRNVHLPTEDPHVKSFSPISDSSDVDPSPPGPVAGRKHRFPSPPPYRPRIPELIPERSSSENKGQGEPQANNNGSKPDRQSNSAPGDGPGSRNLGIPPKNNNRERSPSRSIGGNDNQGRSSAPGFNNGNGITPTSLPSSKSPAPLMKQADVSIRAANGKLGGVVRAGGGPDDQAPQGWKPWAKSS